MTPEEKSQLTCVVCGRVAEPDGSDPIFPLGADPTDFDSTDEFVHRSCGIAQGWEPEYEE